MDDLALPQHHRSGAHRARRHPVLAALVTLGGVAVASAVLLWALLSFDVLGVGDDLREAGVAAPDPSAAPSDAPSPGAEAPSQDSTGTPSGPPVDGPSAPEPSPVASADRTLPLTVLNSTGTPGLAAEAGEALADRGWQVDEVGNYDGEEIPTAVLYPEEPDDPAAAAVLAATAAAVAADLGLGEAAGSADVDGLTVVLGPDYEP